MLERRGLLDHYSPVGGQDNESVLTRISWYIIINIILIIIPIIINIIITIIIITISLSSSTCLL